MQRNWKACRSCLRWQYVCIVSAGPLVYSFLDVEDMAQPCSATVSLHISAAVLNDFHSKRLQRFKTGTWCIMLQCCLVSEHF